MIEDGKVVEATDEDYLRITDGRGGRVVLRTARLALMLFDAAEAGESLEEALAGMVQALASLAGRLAQAGFSGAAVALFVAEALGHVRRFAEAFAAVLGRAAGGGA